MARTTNTQNDGKKYGHTYATPMRHGVRYSVPDKSGMRSETNYNHEEYVENVSNLSNNRPTRYCSIESHEQ